MLHGQHQAGPRLQGISIEWLRSRTIFSHREALRPVVLAMHYRPIGILPNGKLPGGTRDLKLIRQGLSFLELHWQLMEGWKDFSSLHEIVVYTAHMLIGR